MVIFGNDTVTVYNRHLDEITGEETWIPTVLHKCNITSAKGYNISKTGIENADSAKLIFDSDSIPEGKILVGAMEYKKLTLAEKENCVTFQPEDFFVKGNTSSVEVLEEGFLEYMARHYDCLFRVTTVDYFDNVLPHIEVGGK